MRRPIVVTVVLALAAVTSLPFVACTGGGSGNPASSDGGGAIDKGLDGAAIPQPTASTASSDGSTPPLPGACFTSAGALDPSMRACAKAEDCTIANVPEDCCGRVHAAGVSTSSTSP